MIALDERFIYGLVVTKIGRWFRGKVISVRDFRSFGRLIDSDSGIG